MTLGNSFPYPVMELLVIIIAILWSGSQTRNIPYNGAIGDNYRNLMGRVSNKKQ